MTWVFFSSLYIYLFISPTQQKRKLRIYISNTYTPSKPEGEEAEKVSSWELRVEGKLLEEVSEQTLELTFESPHPSVVRLQYFSLCYCVSENFQSLSSGWPVSLAQTTQPDVCLQLSSLHPATPQTHTHTHTHTYTCSCSLLKWGIETTGRYIPWADMPPLPPSIQLQSLCHPGPHEGGFFKNFFTHPPPGSLV